jgi:hypothetical protein
MASMNYFDMRDLIIQNNTKYPGIFTHELLTAIFWEESRFQNITQQPTGPAVGFGQVERQEIPAVCSYAKISPTWTPQQILTDDNKSVQIAMYALAKMFDALNRNKLAALNGYAGANRFNPTTKKWEATRNAIIPPHWLQCETKLIAIHSVYNADCGLDPHDAGDDLIAALKLAAPNSDPSQAF